VPKLSGPNSQVAGGWLSLPRLLTAVLIFVPKPDMRNCPFSRSRFFLDHTVHVDALYTLDPVSKLCIRCISRSREGIIGILFGPHHTHTRVPEMRNITTRRSVICICVCLSAGDDGELKRLLKRLSRLEGGLAWASGTVH